MTYYDEPTSNKGKKARKQLQSSAVLDWATLHPVERMELLTTHDLARQERQKLELLRNLLTYYHYATSESREEVLRVEINRVRAAADELRERYRAEYNHTPETVNHDYAPVPVKDNYAPAPASNNYAPARVNDNTAFDEAHTTIINGRHRRDLG